MAGYHGQMPNRNCITGDTDYLCWHLKESMDRAHKIDIMVSFLMESGVRLLVQDLKKAVDRGVPIRIPCGNYMCITQPSALYLLKDKLDDKVDLRFYDNPGKSFHPKAYFFEYDKDAELYIGSSNISGSALTFGIEWNYRLLSAEKLSEYGFFKKTFENLFLNQSIIVDDVEMQRYSKNWRKPNI